MEKTHNYIDLLEKHAPVLNIISHLVIISSDLFPCASELQNECDKLKMADNWNMRNITTDCSISVGMFGNILQKQPTLIKEILNHDLGQIVSQFQECGYVVIRMRCLISHDSHFFILINILDKYYLIQSYFEEYELKVREICDPIEFLSQIFQLRPDNIDNDRSFSYSKMIWETLTNLSLGEKIEKRTCEPILHFYMHKKNWRPFSEILEDCEITKKLLEGSVCKHLETNIDEVKNMIEDLINYLKKK